MLTSDEVNKIPCVPEATTVIGDIDNIVPYIQSGQALCDWRTCLQQIQDEFDAYVIKHKHVWDNIIIHFRQ